jgi:hypothetical protein
MNSEPIAIPDDIAAKCDGPDQAGRFDAGVRTFLAVPKSAVLKDEAKVKRRKKKAKKPVLLEAATRQKPERLADDAH